jgi:hypothetical protein
MNHDLAAWVGLLLAASFHPCLAGPGPAAQRPVVLELFTSQSCSSCPPAEALLTELQAASAGVVTLSLHVDYWNYLSWRDPFSLQQATSRQRAYAAALGTEVFTPQLIIDGRTSAVGSDKVAIRAAIAAAVRAQTAGPALSATRVRDGLAIAAGPGAGQGTLLLVGYDPVHTTHVGSGENGGAVLTETNIVRSLAQIGGWAGQPVALTVKPPQGERAIVLLQKSDGTILAAALPG